MGEMTIAYGNAIENAVITGGAAFPTMPVTNLQDRQLGVKWRTINLLPASTQFDLEYVNKDPVRVVALANHNLFVDAKYRLRASDDPTFFTSPATVVSPGFMAGSPVGLLLTITYAVDSGDVITVPAVEDIYDSGWTDVWPVVFASTDLEWNADNFWSGKYLQSDLVGYMKTLPIILPGSTRARYWRLEFDDPNNPDLFVEAGRLFMAPSWAPVFNASFGATLGWETGTEVQEAISGAEFFDVRTPFRVAQFRFENLSDNEALAGPFEIIRKVGIDKEVFFMWDPDDTVHATRRQFLGRFRTLSPLEFPDGFINGNELTGDFRASVPFVVKELVG